MPVRVEKDIVIYVPAVEPGAVEPRSLELREAGDPWKVVVFAGQFGREVSIGDLREALDRAEREFAPPLRSA